MAKKIAIVKLAPGEIGFQDQLSNLYLTLSNPVGEVYDNCNYQRIKQAIANKQIELVQGSIVRAM